MRELSLQRKDNLTGPGKQKRKRYIYYDHLKFLRSNLKSEPCSSEPDDQDEPDEEEAVQGHFMDNSLLIPETTIETSRKAVKREPVEVEPPMKRTAVEVARPPDEDDTDRMFLLSMVNEMRRIPEENKLDLKVDILQLFKKWRGRPNNNYSNHY